MIFSCKNRDKYFYYILSSIVLWIFIVFPSNTYALNPNLENAYESFLEKLEKKYPVETQDIILRNLANRVENLKYSTTNQSVASLLSELQLLNNEALYSIWLEKELSPAQQKIQELREISSFKKTLSDTTLPSYITPLLWKNVKYVKINDLREFYENGEIYRILYTSYFPVIESNIRQLWSKNWIIIRDLSWEYRFIENYETERKIPYSELIGKFKVYLTEKHRVNERNGSFYGYNFLNFRFFDDKYWAYESNIKSSWFDYNTTLLYKREDWGYNFVTDYSEYKIANSWVVFGSPEKHLLLDYLREDAKYETTDISQQLIEIRKLSESLTKWKNRQESIAAIYAWILWNIEYSRIIDLSDEKIFSGIETFKNSQWVCTWYTKLSSYLFYFSWYHDVEVIRWHVIDAQDFPEIWHAWLKIWDLYYDPTFDDPIWAQNTKSPDEYKYFWLPKDIFYANRYEYGDLPEFLNTASKVQIRQHIFDKLTKLVPKYQSTISQYPVFWEVLFRNKYNIGVSTTITPQLLSQKIGSFNVDNNSFRFTEDGISKTIAWFRYYPLTSENTTAVLDIFWYDTSMLKLFNWQKADGSREWRLAYELEIR